MGKHKVYLLKVLVIGFYCSFSNAHGQSQECIDTDGDGWGWNGVASCFVEQVVGACVDSDGDGYGWNGIATCDLEDDPDNCTYPAGDRSQWGWDEVSRLSCPPLIDPVLPGECVDADGDGWGWNGVDSCRTSCITAGGYVREDLGACVGVPTGLTLLDYSPDMSEESQHVLNESDEVIEGKTILGCVRIMKPNITFKNNHVTCYNSRDIAWDTGVTRDRETIGKYYKGGIYVHPDADNAIIENNTIICDKRMQDTAPCDYGVLAENATVRYNYIAGAVDGIDVRSNTDIRFNVIENLSVTREEWRNDYSHADGIQLSSSSSSDITIEGNVIRGVSEAASFDSKHDAMGAILLQGSSNSQSKPDILIKNNYITGYWPANRISCLWGAACSIEGNTVDRHYGGVINTDRSVAATTIRCNTFTDGQFIESENAFSANVDNSNCMLP